MSENDIPMESADDDDASDAESAAGSSVGPSAADAETVALMHQVDGWLSHVWMVRAFLKHSDEATDDEELADIHRALYDYMLALGPSLDANDAARYLRIARKKLSKLRVASETFTELQPEISGHMNFRMAAKSLSLAVSKLHELLT